MSTKIATWITAVTVSTARLTQHRTHARPRANDGTIYEPVRVAVPVAVSKDDMLVIRLHEAESEMSVRARVVVAMNAATVAMRSGGRHDP